MTSRPTQDATPDRRPTLPGGSGDGGDMAGAEYWDNARPLRTGGSVPRVTFHRWLGRRYERLLAHLLADVPPSATLLEIGCAPGWVLARIARVRPDLHLHGVDYAPAGVDDTRRLLADQGVRAHVEHAAVEEYEPESAFDAVLSAGLLEHFGDPGPITEQHVRVARPGAIVIVTVPDLRTPVIGGAARWLAAADFATHNTALMTPEDLGRTLAAAGLTRVRSGRAGGAMLFVPRRRRFTPLEATYRAFAYSWNALAALVPDAISPWHAHIWATGVVDPNVAGIEDAGGLRA